MGDARQDMPHDGTLLTPLKAFWNDFWFLTKKAQWEEQPSTLPNDLESSDILKAWETQAKCSTTFTLLDYYKFTRQEVEREDGILHQRLSWMLAFQGFLFVAAGTLISGLWSSSAHIAFKAAFGVFVAAVGFALSILSMSGVDAATNSLEAVKADWVSIRKACNVDPHLVPQTFGRTRERIPFAEYMPRVFVLAWITFAIFIGIAALLPAPPQKVCYVITSSPASVVIFDDCPQQR